MSEKDTYIKVPPGSNIEIKTGNEDKKDVEDLAKSSSGASYSAINSSQVNEESTYNAPAESSAQSSSSQESLSSNSSQGTSSTESAIENSSHGETSLSEALEESETSDHVKNIEPKDDDKKTLKVKIKNYFKFK
jgi:hypothetical protein